MFATGASVGAAVEWGEIVRTEGADVRATFVGDLLDGLPAITRDTAGDGVAWCVATAPVDLGAVVDEVLASAGVESEVADLPDGVEAVRRGDRLFLLNWNPTSVQVEGRSIPPRGSVILRG